MDFRAPFSVVTPTLDGAVLAVLARSDRALSGRQVHRLAGHGSEEGVRKVLERLSGTGVVLRDDVGAAHLYRLNRNHLAAPHIEAIADLGADLVRHARSAIDGWKTPAVVALLFGSVARGEGGSDSDIDVLVVRRKDCDADDPQWRDQLNDLSEQLHDWSGNDPRILEYGVDETGRLGNEGVVSDALADGIRLGGSTEALHALMRRSSQ